MKRYCFVPHCHNNSKKNPHKLFFNVPQKESDRTRWCNAVGKTNVPSFKTHLYCCEDHFMLEEDVQDWFRYKFLKQIGKKTFALKLKPGVLPRASESHLRESSSSSKPQVSTVPEKEMLETVSETHNDFTAGGSSEISTPPIIYIKTEVLDDTESESEEICHSRESYDPITHVNTEEMEDVKPTADELIESLYPYNQPIENVCVWPDVPAHCNETCREEYMDVEPKIEDSLESINMPDVSAEVGAQDVQVPTISNYGNVYVQTPTTRQISVRSFASLTKKNTSKLASMQPVNGSKRSDRSELEPSVSPAGSLKPDEDLSDGIDDEAISIATSEGDFDFFTDEYFHGDQYLDEIRTKMSDEEDSIETKDSFNFKDKFFAYHLRLITQSPEVQLGLDKKNMKILSLLEELSGLPQLYIFIVLRMVFGGRDIEGLGVEFRCTKSTITRVLTQACPVAAAFFQQFIFCPDKETIKANLPLMFRSKFSKVQCIIDCFEFRIKKPRDKELQKLVFSKRYRTSTLKYLISYTPDGFFNFVSQGYGGRSTCVEMFEECSFLEKLKPNTVVMVRRGFKGIEDKLREKQCILVRPPREVSATVCVEGEIKRKKVINPDLNNYLERVIYCLENKYRFFWYCTNHRRLLNFADNAVIIACALSNLCKPFDEPFE